MSRVGPFGDLNKDIGRQRLLCVGFGLGLMCGVGMPDNGWEWVGFLFGLFLVVVRTASQIKWPDRLPPED